MTLFLIFQYLLATITWFWVCFIPVIVLIDGTRDLLVKYLYPYAKSWKARLKLSYLSVLIPAPLIIMVCVLAKVITLAIFAQ